jgi:hypothetical protein
MKRLLILVLCCATAALASDQLKKYEIKYVISTSTTRIIIVESTDSYQARKTFEDMLPRGEVHHHAGS